MPMARTKGFYTQAARCFRILDRLRGRRTGVLLRDLVQEFEVDPTQIKRDLRAIDAGGHPTAIILREEQGPSGKTRQSAVVVLRERSSLSMVPLTREERYSLLAVRRIFDVFQGTPFFKDV